jgi:hypothetical protein
MHPAYIIATRLRKKYEANLSGADLSGALNLAPGQLDQACGNSNTKLPEGLTIKRCSTD